MNLSSEHFVVRNLKESDKESLRSFEVSRPWAKALLNFSEELKKKTDYKEEDDYDYFEDLWESYNESEHFWVIESKERGFCGDVQLDMDSETEACFYIQITDDADLTGFGKELLDQVIETISKKFGITEFYVSLWDEKDRSKSIYEEAGYEFDNGYLEINL